MLNNLQVGSLVKIICLANDVVNDQVYNKTLYKIGFIINKSSHKYHVKIGKHSLSYLPEELAAIVSTKNNIFEI